MIVLVGVHAVTALCFKIIALEPLFITAASSCGSDWSCQSASVLAEESCLPSDLAVAPQSKVLSPRTNCPRRSGRPPVPFACDQFVGHVARLNAITAHGGTEYLTSSFHFDAVTASPEVADIAEYAAKHADTASAETAIPSPIPRPFFIHRRNGHLSSASIRYRIMNQK